MADSLQPGISGAPPGQPSQGNPPVSQAPQPPQPLGSLQGQTIPAASVPAAYVMKTNGNGNGAAFPIAPTAQTLSSLLGPKPAFSARIMEDAERRRRSIAKTVFWMTIFVFLGTFGFFKRELDPKANWFADTLGSNTSSLFEASNSELKDKQTDLNRIRFKTARLLLDDVNSQIDVHQKHANVLVSSFATTADKQKARAELDNLNISLKRSLSLVQKIMSRPLGIDTYSQEPVTALEREAEFEKLLLERLQKEQSIILANTSADEHEARTVESLMSLVKNKPFRGKMKSLDIENISDEKFTELLSEIRAEGTDQLSVIDKIRRERLDWRELIADIHTVVLKADDNYGRGFFETVGGFLFSSYRFDAQSGRISITGVTKTADSKTFTAIANLVDAVERSPKFKDIDFRSFTKAKDDGGDYSSSLSLEFSLQPKDEKNPRDETITPESL